MTRLEHLLTILAEEAVEVAQRCTKALRFGLLETQPDQAYTNATRLEHEIADLLGVCGMLAAGQHIVPLDTLGSRAAAKRERVEAYLRYSATLGTLDAGENRAAGG